MQPPVNPESRFALRVDWPDTLKDSDGNQPEGEDYSADLDEIALQGKLDALAHFTDLSRLTEGEAPLIVEVRRTK